jgi:hypothetical protein
MKGEGINESTSKRGRRKCVHVCGQGFHPPRALMPPQRHTAHLYAVQGRDVLLPADVVLHAIAAGCGWAGRMLMIKHDDDAKAVSGAGKRVRGAVRVCRQLLPVLLCLAGMAAQAPVLRGAGRLLPMRYASPSIPPTHQERASSFTPRRSNSPCKRAASPSSVVHTGV